MEEKTEEETNAAAATDLLMLDIVKDAAQELLKAIRETKDDGERADLAMALSDLTLAWVNGRKVYF